MLPCPPASSHFPGVLGVQPGPLSHCLQPLTDLTGKPVCVVRDELSLATSPQATLLPGYLIRMPTIPVPVGDPQSNRDPRLYSGGYWGPLPWGYNCPQGLPGLGRCLRRKRPWLLGGGPRYLGIHPCLDLKCLRSQNKQRTNRSGQQTCDFQL